MSIALGTITGCFGGVVRDVLLNNVPVIFHKEIYASACIAGGILFFVLQWAGANERIVQISCMLAIVLIRIIAVRFHLSIPAIKRELK